MQISHILLIVLIAIIAYYYNQAIQIAKYDKVTFENNKKLFNAPNAKLVNAVVCPTAYYEEGANNNNSELVVLVHGFSTPYKWAYGDMAKKLGEKGYHVIGYDLCGRGLSGAAASNVAHTGEMYVAQLSFLLMQLNLSNRSFHLVGSSMGGAISILFADAFPQLVKSLQLIAPAGYDVNSPPIGKLVKLPILGEILYSTAGRYVMKQNYYKNLAVKEVERKKLIDETVRILFLQFDHTSGYAMQLLNTLRHFPMNALQDTYKRVGKHSRNVQFIWGEDDTLCQYESVKELLKIMPNAKLKSFKGFSHGIIVNGHDLVYPELLTFLEENK